MIGRVFDNPRTGEKVTVLLTGAETEGQLFRADYVLRAGSAIGAEHVHPKQEQRVEVLSGVMHCRIDGEEHIVRPGEAVVIPAGARHFVWNSGAEPLHAIDEYRPDLNMERYFEKVFSLPPTASCDA
jgi:quercetin dioxygenase-like cupin family protein